MLLVLEWISLVLMKVALTCVLLGGHGSQTERGSRERWAEEKQMNASNACGGSSRRLKWYVKISA
jgi:hypothetical protein